MMKNKLIPFFWGALSLAYLATPTFADVIADMPGRATGCKVLNLNDAETSALWSGSCVDEKISGAGVLVINFIETKASCTQTGEFKEGLRHGFAKSNCTDGSSLEGMFTNGILTSKGIRIGPDGDRWEGEYKDGLLNGQGTHTFAKLPKYDYRGMFKDNKYNGQGEQTFPNGEKRVGEFKDGDFSKGVVTYPNKTKYEGDFKKDEPHGKGKLTYELGTTYEGDFEHGMYHGQGRLIYLNGDHQIGLFRAGRFVGGNAKFSGSLKPNQEDPQKAHQKAQAEFNQQKRNNIIDQWNRSRAWEGI